MRVRTPIIVVNFKCYHEAMGKNAVKLAKMAEEASLKTDVCIAVAVQPVDIFRVAKEASIPVFAQHVDAVKPGSFTGHVLPEAVKEAGAVGTLINHSEKRLNIADIDAIVTRVREVGLTSLVCANNALVSKAIASLDPDMVAVEVPELIGSGRAISKVKPEIVLNTVKLIKSINERVSILCGAGIVDPEDVAAALRLGTEGVLVASGVVKAKNPFDKLLGFAQACVEV